MKANVKLVNGDFEGPGRREGGVRTESLKGRVLSELPVTHPELDFGSVSALAIGHEPREERKDGLVRVADFLGQPVRFSNSRYPPECSRLVFGLNELPHVAFPVRAVIGARRLPYFTLPTSDAFDPISLIFLCIFCCEPVMPPIESIRCLVHSS